jgi:Ran GTPase-activating protein (RanGAP) involved in mRNA processing and transport
MLAVNNKVQILHVLGNQIGSAGAIAMAKGLSFNTAVEEIDWTYNEEVGDTGAVALASALETNTALLKLHLHWLQISDVGASALAAALETRSPPLHLLHLRYNNVGDVGAAAVAQWIKARSPTFELDLRGKLKVTCHRRPYCVWRISRCQIDQIDYFCNLAQAEICG